MNLYEITHDIKVEGKFHYILQMKNVSIVTA